YEKSHTADSACAEVDLVHQQTQNQRYGSSHIGATAKDISNVVTDAASGVVDIFHGIDKRSEERRVGKECRYGWLTEQSKKKRTKAKLDLVRGERKSCSSIYERR